MSTSSIERAERATCVGAIRWIALSIRAIIGEDKRRLETAPPTFGGRVGSFGPIGLAAADLG